MTLQAHSVAGLKSRRGKALLALLLGVGFLDFVDASIVNVALPSIRGQLGFTVQNLQWVLSAYLLTYGGLILLGGRLADLFGRRRIVVTGTVIFLASSMTAGLATGAELMVGSRLIQGAGAALMVPAALSLITTTFRDPRERQKALGAWGGLAGLASGFGVLLGGLLTDLIDWRWVFFVNLPVAVAILIGVFRLVPADGPIRFQRIDVVGALLVTAGMLLLVYTIVEAPTRGWSANRTLSGLFGAGAVLLAFVIWELRQAKPLFPLSVLRIKGLAAADVTMIVAMAGFYSMFFFITLYMQSILRFSPWETGAAYLPVTLIVAVGAGLGTVLLGRVGTRPVIVAGAVFGGAGIFWLSRIPVDGTYVSDLLPALLVMGFGLGGVFVGVTTAAQAGVPEDQAGLAAALINSSQWLGGALGIAIFSAIATARTSQVLAEGGAAPEALTSGFQDALLWAAIFIGAAAVIAVRSPNTHGHEVGGATASVGGGAGAGTLGSQ